jgi:hypothetical protein
MRNRYIVISAIKIQGVIQILSVTIINAPLESKVAKVSCGATLGARLEPLPGGIGAGWSGGFLWWNLRDKHIENETSGIGREQKMNAPVSRKLDRIIMLEEWVLRRGKGKSFRRKPQRMACLIKLTQKHHHPKESKNSRKCQTRNQQCAFHIIGRLTTQSRCGGTGFAAAQGQSAMSRSTNPYSSGDKKSDDRWHVESV